MAHIECYDIGGTNLRGAVFDSETDRKIVEKTVKTKRSKSNFLKQLRDISKNLRSDISKNISAVSIGVPGPVENNFLLKAPPMHLNKKIDFRKEAAFSEEIFVLNDMDAAVLAEKNFGRGKDLNSICLVTFSTGIGAGTVINGNLIPGGEYGHIVLERNGPKCSCGRRGCWTSFCSGYGIELASGMKPENFFKQTDSKSKDLIKKIRDYNAQGFGNIINAVQVDKIFATGPIALNHFDKIIPKKEEIKRYTVNKIPNIAPAELGKEAGLLGAFVFGKNKVKE
ncbi:MAG: ROK family protein [Candidatus Undinarchaeales archaeon]